MSQIKFYYVYIITNWNNRVLYIGVTNDLMRRISEHKQKILGGFSSKYNINKLVYFETYEDPKTAIYREKVLKKWRREKKNRLVESKNPRWEELPIDLSN